MLNTSFLQNNKLKILVIKIHQRNVKIPSEELSWPNWIAAYFLKVSPPATLSIPESAETARIWHLALREGSSFPCECRVAPDCTKSSWKCSSLGLLWEPGTDVQHPTAPAGTEELWCQPQPGSWAGLTERKPQQFLSLAHQCYGLSQLENLVLCLRLFTRNQLPRVTFPFKYGDVPPLE